MDTARTCLKLPLPKQVRDLIKEPPVYLSDSCDAQVIRLIERFGRRHNRSRNEIQKAQELAAGVPDIAIILERPKGNYHLSFHNFVQDCKTLKAVDELIRVASQGARSISTTVVLDAHMLKPQKNDITPTDDECFDLVVEILRIKRPKVVLCCWKGRRWQRGHSMSELESPGMGKGSILDIVCDPIKTIRVSSFHPMKTLGYDACNVFYRSLIVLQFVVAFAALTNGQVLSSQVRETFHWLNKNALYTSGTRQNYNPDRDAATLHVQRHLSFLLGERRRFAAEHYVGFVDDEISQTPDDSEVEKLFGRLRDHPYSGGGLEIGKLVLLLNEHFKDAPFLAEAELTLLRLGNAQESFLEDSSAPAVTAADTEVAQSTVDEIDLAAIMSTLSLDSRPARDSEFHRASVDTRSAFGTFAKSRTHFR